jgi:hypothetical protein
MGRIVSVCVRIGCSNKHLDTKKDDVINGCRELHNEDRRHFNPLNAELNPICRLLALLGAHHIFHVSGLRVKLHGVNDY